MLFTGDSPEFVVVLVPQMIADVAAGVSAEAVADRVNLSRSHTADLDQLCNQPGSHSADEPRVRHCLGVRRSSTTQPVHYDNVAILTDQQLSFGSLKNK